MVMLRSRGCLVERSGALARPFDPTFGDLCQMVRDEVRILPMDLRV